MNRVMSGFGDIWKNGLVCQEWVQNHAIKLQSKGRISKHHFPQPLHVVIAAFYLQHNWSETILELRYVLTKGRCSFVDLEPNRSLLKTENIIKDFLKD